MYCLSTSVLCVRMDRWRWHFSVPLSLSIPFSYSLCIASVLCLSVLEAFIAVCTFWAPFHEIEDLFLNFSLSTPPLLGAMETQRCLYEVLGVERTSSNEEIFYAKKALFEMAPWQDSTVWSFTGILWRSHATLPRDRKSLRSSLRPFRMIMGATYEKVFAYLHRQEQGFQGHMDLRCLLIVLRWEECLPLMFMFRNSTTFGLRSEL